MDWSQITIHRGATRPGADPTNRVGLQSPTPRYTIQVMRHRAPRAPHDSATLTLSCSPYLLLLKVPKMNGIPKKEMILSNPKGPTMPGPTGRRSRGVQEQTEDRNAWRSGATESSLVAESNHSKTVCVRMYSKYALSKKKEKKVWTIIWQW